MHTQDTKFEWPFIQCISVKPLLRLKIDDNQFRITTETALYLSNLHLLLINNHACLVLSKYYRWPRKNEI